MIEYIDNIELIKEFNMEKVEKLLPDETLARDVIDLLRELLHALLMSSVPAWLNLQLTLPQLRTIFIIAHNTTSSVMQISQDLGVGKPTASYLVDKLVQAGLVERNEDPEDRRRARVQLTQAGVELIQKLLGWEEFLGGRLNQISKEDLSTLKRGLTVVMEKLPEEATFKTHDSHH